MGSKTAYQLSFGLWKGFQRDDGINSNLVMYLVGLVRLSALHNIYNRDARLEVDSDACREEIDV